MKYRKDDLIRAREDAIERIKILQDRVDVSITQAETSDRLAAQSRDAVRRIDAIWEIRDEYLGAVGSESLGEEIGTAAEFRESTQAEREQRAARQEKVLKHVERSAQLLASAADDRHGIDFLEGFVRHLDGLLESSSDDPSDSPRTGTRNTATTREIRA